MADALLTVENLTKSFGDKLLFEDISFGINAGQKSALIARNGYGKSTLLNIIMTAAMASSPSGRQKTPPLRKGRCPKGGGVFPPPPLANTDTTPFRTAAK